MSGQPHNPIFEIEVTDPLVPSKNLVEKGGKFSKEIKHFVPEDLIYKHLIYNSRFRIMKNMSVQPHYALLQDQRN